MSTSIGIVCPKCCKKLKAPPEMAGKRAKCPGCNSIVTVPSSGAASEPGSDSGPIDDLIASLQRGDPADISTVRNATLMENRARFYEAVVTDATAPCLTYFILKANADDAQNPYLVVITGDRSEHDIAWNFNYEAILRRALPGGTWDDMVGEGDANYSNHSKPGCSLASTAPFDNLASQILQRLYKVERVIRPAHPPQKRAQRWDVLIIGEPVSRPDVACQICGDDRVSPGWNGSHRRCRRCGVIFCRRNCMASIHGQCPRCGEADRIEAVE